MMCPLCGSNRSFRDGWRRLADGSKIQRYLCRECGYRFTDPSYRHEKTRETSNLSRSRGSTTHRDEDLGLAGSRSDMGGGLVLENPLHAEEKPAGDAATQFALKLLASGRSENTARVYRSVLRMISEKADIYDPEAVKRWLAKADLAEVTKKFYCEVYDAFLKSIGGSWEKPKYKGAEKIPFIPTEEELDQLIAGCGRKLATFLQLLKETGARVGEALALKWTDVDFERRIVNITAEKGGRARILPISLRLVDMLNNLPKRGERVFTVSMDGLKSNFFLQRKKIAKKLGNPRLLKITFHTFRHWKATVEYHRTRDIVYVKEILGHKNIENTMVYISIEKALFQYKKDEFHCKTASTVEEASKLIEAGFEYVAIFNGVMLFRKRK